MNVAVVTTKAVGGQTTQAVGVLLGTQGIPGANGRTMLSGSGAPAVGLGADGDFYIDTATVDLYGPKASGAWGAAVSLIGPQGEQGDIGLTGKSAYQSAVDGGYTGTESDFNTLFAGLGDISAALDAIVG